MTTEESVRACVLRRGLLKAGDRVIVGVSGGADSLCLLYSLFSLRGELGLAGLRAAHVNHGLRGAQADGDEELTRRHCAKLGIPLEVLRVNCAAEAKKRKIGVEECGRILRYGFFEEQANGAKIALAHTLSDRCETLLFNLARGCSARGLLSIPYSREEGTATVIRPLLDTTRAQVEEYCARGGIEYATDASNADTAYSRNRLRAEVMPQLRELNPRYEQAFLRMFNSVENDVEYLENSAEELLCGCVLHGKEPNGIGMVLDARALLAAPEPILGRALRLLLERVGAPVTATALERLRGVLAGGRTSLGGNVLAACSGSALSFGRERR
ncbi:MAG: tRNA lysidine(34) synthetase TilS [Clostridium sp.]|jgi:tRNA(Ile)-lysidine synthase|nr:tRNA lysidine(34) synthetase TilS [Clostridium sp.]